MIGIAWQSCLAIIKRCSVLAAMGKSPAKWIKTVLFGKKSSRSTTSKGRERLANEKEVPVTGKASDSLASSDPPIASHPIPSSTQTTEREVELERNEATEISADGRTTLSGNQVADPQTFTPQEAPCDPEKIKQDEAATKAQAAFRGYLARRAFRALKGIIRLQALIRGHLVRRQTVATLRSMLGIVKLQALVRGRKIRNSDIGLEVRKKCYLGMILERKHATLSMQLHKLPANAFVHKLLASSSTVTPLCLQYDPSEPNSVSNWLERWSASHFWKPVPQPNKVSDSKSQKKQVNTQATDTETGRPKHSVRRVPAANIDIVPVQSTPEFEKSKRNLKKVSSHAADPVHENPQNELEKVKRSLRKVHNPIVDSSVPVQSEVEYEKPKQRLEKMPSASSREIPEHNGNDSVEKMEKETTSTMSKVPEVETTPEPVERNETSDIPPAALALIESNPEMENKIDETVTLTNGEVKTKEDLTNGVLSKKTSVPVKQERAENGMQSSPTLPSYMAATQSAKAKLRLQGSPRSGQDRAAEKSSGTRRHSLPSTNSKINSQSPRTQRPAGKGSNKGDKVSTRDGNAKLQAEWKR